MRRVALILGIVMLSACSPTVASDSGERESLQVRVTELETKITAIRSKVDTLEAAQGELSGAVGEFDDTNWREVVPKVTEAAEAVETATAEVKSEAEN